ncbi:MAG TPA: nitronate monooxygenase [Acidimicrobiales bacterium]|nr:nitronate monooxygenase [Acidimicrobiales bacterium]
MAVRTRFTELFDLEHPIMSAPMVMHSGGRLAAAVSAAGGLGAFGGIHPGRDADWLRAEVATARTGGGAFAVGFITPFLPMTERFLEATIDERPDAICFSFADPGPWAARAKDAGIRVLCQVQDHEGVAMAVDAGADVLIAQGTEAGGHTGTMSLLPFLASVVARHPDIPVLAAGGVADGRTLAAALLAGADGAVMGTAFLATPEAVEVHDTYKQLIVDSDGADTVLTHAYDIVSGLPWPATIHDRVRRNRFTAEWADRDTELRARREEVAAAVAPTGEPDPDRDAIRYGQSAAFVDAVRPAGEVLRAVSAEAEALLRDRPAAVLR